MYLLDVFGNLAQLINCVTQLIDLIAIKEWVMLRVRVRVGARVRIRDSVNDVQFLDLQNVQCNL